METSGPSFTVVEPGSPDDPFSSHNPANAATASVPAATPVVETPASQPNASVPSVEAPTIESTKPGSVPVSTPAAPAVTTTGLTQEQVDKIVSDRLREAQSGWDRRNQLLQEQVKQEKERIAALEKQHRDELRKAQLEGLPLSERTRMQEVWEIEDARAEVKAQRDAVTQYHQTVEGLRLFQEYHIFGVTEDDLLGLDVDKMEAFCKDKKLAFFEAGGNIAEAGKGNTPAAKPAAAPAAKPGSSAPYDPGGMPPAPEGTKLLTTQGVQSLGANIKSMFAN